MVNQMCINLTKAVRNTHKNPINMILHFIGLPVYAAGIVLIVG